MTIKAKPKSDEPIAISIKAPNFRVLNLRIRGTTPYVFNNFAEEARQAIADKQAAGDVGKRRRAPKPPKDFDSCFRGSLHRERTGAWYGQPAMAYKQALVRACSVLGLEMIQAKMCLFVLGDGWGEQGEALVRILKGEPERFDANVRNSGGGMDVRARGRFLPGWEANLRVRYDGDWLSPESVCNLVMRAGISVGIGAGRVVGKESTGDWGTWEIVER